MWRVSVLSFDVYTWSVTDECICCSLNYFAATESVVLLKLAHVLSMVSKEET